MPTVLFEDDDRREKGFAFCSHVLDQGVYLHPWHNMFLSVAHTESDIEQALARISHRVIRFGVVGLLPSSIGVKRTGLSGFTDPAFPVGILGCDDRPSRWFSTAGRGAEAHVAGRSCSRRESGGGAPEAQAAGR